MSYTIITDSCSDLSLEYVEKLDIVIIPLQFEVAGKLYTDYTDQREITSKAFFDLLRKGHLAKTSQVTPERYLQLYLELYQAGKKEMLVIAFSSALSGTCNAAFLARNQFVEEHPDANILVFDSLCACGGQGLFVYLAAKNRNDLNMSMEDNYKWLEANYVHLAHRFTVENLDTLRRGGRISGAAAAFGNLLGIKPVLHVDNAGALIPTAKVRGRISSLKMIAKYVKETLVNTDDYPIFIHNADDSETGKIMEDLIRAEVPNVKEIVHFDFGPVIGAHTGPGAIGVFFFGTER